MGQDSEAAAELVATIRGEHVAMKTWFQGSAFEAAALRAKYGDYPGLWKEVLNWPGWKEARKAYLKEMEAKRSSNNNSSAAPRKRPSRWGTADDNDGAGNSNDDGASKRRSRWARDPTTAAPPPMPAPVLPGLPGMSGTLSPQQQQEMTDLQGRLRIINEKLANLEREAERVDALPRGHRERSPSPPPGTSFLNRLIFPKLYNDKLIPSTLLSCSAQFMVLMAFVSIHERFDGGIVILPSAMTCWRKSWV